MSPAPNQPLDWYRDVVIYQLHVRSFADSNGSGTGDFDGLTSRLDYIVDLGIDAIWLLPFFPSPLRDDGYDIADYESVNPQYGDMRSFKRFLKGAHDRGLRVIVELVMNHTSDQHPWFQRARRARAGTRYRDYYVWSDTAEKYADARIIFTDTETSNWTWDPVAQAYFWHRFYSHQPDLNFDSPDVRREIFRIFDKWFRLGVDGVRLDAVPYLFEREGTNCENLPETHEFLRSLRAHMDEHYPGRLLLAEANQWPEDSVEYFGKGDECHMAFHFPVMPRLFMAVQMESRAPIVDILEQTPALPDGCQWAVFLRNHDELTLEMVTDEERDYMYRRYAGDPRMRINVGIRRRLSTLLQNDRRKVELLNALLLSMPGTPVIYYGDEIGMGDNVYLGDRDSVRTPMQWSDDRNAGFSTADPQQLFLPVITDSQHHFENVNVEAQRRNPMSLWWWMRRMIAMRQRNPVFARGDMIVLESDNTRVFTFLRRLEGHDDILVVANLSRHAQQVNIPLVDYHDVRPVELAGGAVLAPIDDGEYRLTLGPHDVFWLRLPHPVESVVPDGPPVVEFTLDPLQLPLNRRATASLLFAARSYLIHQRWFGDRDRTITDLSVTDAFEIGGVPRTWLALVHLDFDTGEPSQYAVTLGEERRENGHVVASADPPAAGALTRLLLRGERSAGRHGTLSGLPRRRIALRKLQALESRSLGTEQSNSSSIVDDRWILKLLRRVESGIHPEVELLSHLNEVGFTHVPELVGTLDYVSKDGREPSTVASLVAFVRSDGDASEAVRHQASQFLEVAVALPESDGPIEIAPSVLVAAEPPASVAEALTEPFRFAETLGIRTAELHQALAAGEGTRFAPQNFNAHAQRSMYQALRTEARTTLRMLRATGAVSLMRIAAVEQAITRRGEDIIRRTIDGQRIRVHGDMHLGQILVRGPEITFIDFEGEPSRPLGERAIKRTPLVDVAGMVRSYDYAAHAAYHAAIERGMGHETRLSQLADAFQSWSSHRFVRAYLDSMEDSDILPTDPDDVVLLLDMAIIQKAAYEVRYEIGHRPGWVMIPFSAMERLAGVPHVVG